MADRWSAVRAPRVTTHAATADEQSLVERIRCGDVASFEQLFQLYYRPLAGFVAAQVGSAVAEDIVQDLFLSVWTRRSEWQVHGSVRAYLYAAARNMALLHRRHGRVVERWELAAVRNEEAPGMGAGDRSIESRAEASEMNDAVSHALASLPARCRQMAVLRLQHHLSYAEVAAVMGVTVKAVERQMTRALKLLRTELSSHQ